MRRSSALLLLLLTSLPWLGACGSTGGRSPGGADGARVLYSDPRVPLTLGIVNDAYLRSIGVEGEDEVLRRANFYSTKRGEVTTKVASDAVVSGLVDALEDNGLARFGLAGDAGGGAGGSFLEVEAGGRTRHFQITQGLEPAGVRAYQDCRAIFLDAYNLIPQFQAADPDQIRLEGPSPVR